MTQQRWKPCIIGTCETDTSKITLSFYKSSDRHQSPYKNITYRFSPFSEGDTTWLSVDLWSQKQKATEQINNVHQDTDMAINKGQRRGRGVKCSLFKDEVSNCSVSNDKGSLKMSIWKLQKTLNYWYETYVTFFKRRTSLFFSHVHVLDFWHVQIHKNGYLFYCEEVCDQRWYFYQRFGPSSSTYFMKINLGQRPIHVQLLETPPENQPLWHILVLLHIWWCFQSKTYQCWRDKKSDSHFSEYIW